MLCKKFLWKDDFVAQNETDISLFDRGYNFGDGIYEVIHAYNGKLFAQKEHLDRLERSAKLIELNLKHTRSDIENLCQQLVSLNGLMDGYIYLQVTRGDKEIRNHKFPFIDEQIPVFSGYAMSSKRDIEKLSLPTEAVTFEDLRGSLCHVKSLNLLPNVLAAHYAQKNDARKAILIKDNIVTEEKSGNILIIKDDFIYTHPDGPHILPGVTKMVIKAACEENGIKYVEKECTQEEMFNADEVIVCDTGSETVSINKIDGKDIGNGQRGPWAIKIQELYVQLIEKECGPL